jgi:hypothetical protein
MCDTQAHKLIGGKKGRRVIISTDGFGGGYNIPTVKPSFDSSVEVRRPAQVHNHNLQLSKNWRQQGDASYAAYTTRLTSILCLGPSWLGRSIQLWHTPWHVEWCLCSQLKHYALSCIGVCRPHRSQDIEALSPHPQDHWLSHRSILFRLALLCLFCKWVCRLTPWSQYFVHHSIKQIQKSQHEELYFCGFCQQPPERNPHRTLHRFTWQMPL